MSGGNDFGSVCANENIVIEVTAAFTLSQGKCALLPCHGARVYSTACVSIVAAINV